ncbi:alpha/beta fold hydrolase [Salinisphaera sp. SPP-AMP-43]|uniref:alpha/beta fold hydrolase n=1 Tax=Salinisphaera sp. SPP-AMP-43 TaxID=3121288 RepID=UPI003C6E375B
MSRRLVTVSAAIAGILAAFSVDASPSLDWRGCAAAAIGQASAAHMQCGWLKTGERLNDMPVRLRVTRLRARPDRPTPQPVIYVPGGPGDPGGQTDAALRAWRSFQQRAGWPRDLVIFDPRGTGRSRPRPGCQAAALEVCFKRLGAPTANALGIRAQVTDLHRLIQAVDAAGAVLWAQSFGAVIARRLQARYPADVRALILDSPVLNPGRIEDRRRATWARRQRQLIAGCRRDLGCRLGVPSASTLIEALMGRRATQPRTLAWARVPYRARMFTVDAQALRAMLLLSGYGVANSSALVNRLRQSLARPETLVSLARPLQKLNDRSAETAPVYWSSRCALSQTATSAICRHWPVSPVAPLDSPRPVPTLVLAGAEDVLTPLSASAQFVLDRPGRQLLRVSGAAHGILSSNGCAQDVVRRFLATAGAWLEAPVCTVIDR